MAYRVFLLLLLVASNTHAQVSWQNVDGAYGPLPPGFHVYKTTGPLDGKPFIAFYAVADLKSTALDFSTDTTCNRRLTPGAFYQKCDQPLLLVNCTFFSFATHQNLNTVISKGKMVAYNVHVSPMRGRDTFQYKHPLGSALGISRKRKADVAWLYTDSSKKYPLALQAASAATQDSVNGYDFKQAHMDHGRMKKWKMLTAVGGGPVLLQKGQIKITNNEELKFSGKAIDDQHPRTLIGYTRNNKLIIMVIQGRMPGTADGATLLQEARLMQELGCVEALNLDGGGSSCMLINGRQTIIPSSNGEQRAVPAVFMVKAGSRR